MNPEGGMPMETSAAGVRPAGAIQGGTPFRLYAEIASSEATGWLRLWNAAGQLFEIGFRKGNPERIRTDVVDLGQDRYLLAKGVVSPEVLQEVHASDGRYIEALVTRGLLPPADAYQHLTSYYRGLLAKALLVDQGRYAWSEEPVTGDGLRLGDRWALLTSIGRRIPFAALETRLGERVGLPVRRADDPRIPWDGLGLAAGELRALSFLDGRQSLAELMASHPDHAHTLLQLGCFLGDAGLLRFGEEGEAPSGPVGANRTAPTPAPAAPVPAPSEEAVLAALREQLAELEKKDLFARLGVPTDAPPQRIRNAYLQLARAYHPDLGGARGEVRKLRAQITALLNEAYDVLSGPGRQAYLEELRTGGTQKVDVSAILEAERKLHVAIALVRERRFEDAARVLDEALALHDAEAELWAYRAYVRMAAARDKDAAKAEVFADLEKARKLGERSPVVFLLSARIANVLGDGAAAIRYYERCLELDPGHQEAARELRLLRSRRV